MLSEYALRNNPLTRNQLAQFLKSPELIRAFEQLSSDVAVILPANEAEIFRIANMALALAAQALMMADRGEPEEPMMIPGPKGDPGPSAQQMALLFEGETPPDIPIERNTPDPRSLFFFGPGGATTPSGVGPYYGLGFSSRPTVFLEVRGANTDLVFLAENGQGQVRFGDEIGNEFFSVDAINERMNCYRPIVKMVYTVATLPTPSSSVPPGSCAFVSDALAPTFGAVVAGGGAVHTPVYVDGAGAWRVG